MQGGGRGKLCAKLSSGFLMKWWVVILIALVLLICGGVVAIFFMQWVNLVINSEIVLKNGSQTFEWWRAPPVNPVMKVYVYNVTNPEEFLSGEKLILDELGPYVYVQTWEKVALKFRNNGTVAFRQRKIFQFDPDQSSGDESDMLVMPNIPMLSATSQSKHATRFLRLAMASILDILNVKPFVNVTVNEILWGYEDTLLKLAKGVVPKEQTLPYEEFGLMYGKNGTSKDRLSVFTGADDITKYGLIDTFNNNTRLPHWKTDQCNRIDGSDGSIFPPQVTKNTTLYVFEKDLCRRLPLRFQKEVDTAGGVQGYRFSPPLDVFANVEKNKDNECFCPSGPPCAPDGFFNVSLCQYDSPVLLSFPHFYLADQKYRTAIDGVSPPDPEKHQLYIDVQPQMGIALAARARVQINLAVSQVVDIKQVATFPDIVFPILWFEDGIDGLPTEVTDLLNLATNAPPVARAALSYGLFALGGVLLVMAISCLVRSSGRQETLNLEGTNHYVKPEKKMNGSSNKEPKGMDIMNPAFVGGPENGATN